MNATKPFPEIWRPFERELRTFYRALPQLLEEDSQNKHVVVRGDETFEMWDTYRDASQFAHRTFDDGKFIIQKIDSRMLNEMEPYFGELSDHQHSQSRQEVA